MTFMMPGMSMIMYCITLGIVWVAAGRIDNGSMQVGTMTAFITYAMMIVMSFLMLSAMSIMLPRAGVAAERIDEVIKTNSTVNDPKEPVTEADHRGVIRFNHVDFRYPGAKEDVLQYMILWRSRQNHSYHRKYRLWKVYTCKPDSAFL